MIPMHGYEIIQELASLLKGDEIIVSSNGNISRQVYHYLPQPQVYLRGSMGLAVPVGLGVALAKPHRQVLAILGDGNLLMGLGSLATTSYVHPNNLRILVLDNNEYATTGHQKTTSAVLNYSLLLDGFGIDSVEQIRIGDPTDIARERIQKLLLAPKLCALAAVVDSTPPKLGNIPLHPEEIARMCASSFDK
jgi:thiamine pyrophosphate-dependent acetolactate synthase large subunit-like protein